MPASAPRLLAGLIVVVGVALALALFSREVRTSNTPLPAPSNLHVLGVTETRVYLAWQDNSGDADAFLVYQAGVTAPVARTSRDTTVAEIGDLHCGTSYRFRVAASNSDGQVLSDAITVATDACDATAGSHCPPDVTIATPADAASPTSEPATPTPDVPTATALPDTRTPDTPVLTSTPAGASLPERLTVPEGYSLHVTESGCLPDGGCPIGQHRANYYWAPARAAVVCADQTEWILLHEACHAHQHLTILETFGEDPAAPYDLHEWFLTPEALDWDARVTTDWPDYGHWSIEPSPHSSLEDFAITCGLYFSSPQVLENLDPQRFNAIEAAFP